MTLRQALDRALESTGLIVAANGSAITVQPPATTQNATTLPTITVTAPQAPITSLNLDAPVTSGALGTRTQLDTPFSTTVVDKQDIERRQASTLGDIFNLDASVVNQGNTYNTRSSYLTVRGLQLDYANGYKLNGLPIINYGVELPYQDFEQVEILKGLSGFMYGFGSPGGIVNFVTKKPPILADGLLLSADVGYKSDGIFKEHVDIGDRFGTDGMFGFRLNAAHEGGETYNGGHVNGNDVSLGLDAHLTPNLTWTLDTLYQKRHASGQVAAISTLLGYTGTSLPSPINGRADNLTSSDGSPQSTEFGLITTGLSYAIAPDWKVSTNYSYSSTNRRYIEDWLYISNPNGDYTERVYDQANKYKFQQWQLMLEGKAQTGPFEHQLVFGTSSQKQTNDGNSQFCFCTIGTGNIYDQNTITYNSAITPSWYRQSTYDQTGFFGSDTIKLTDRWSVLAGARYTNYEQNGYTAAGAQTIHYKKDGVVTPTFALMYKPRPDTTLYGSYVESLEQGAQVPLMYENANDLLKPLKSKQYEVGVKTEHDSWSATASLFRIERGAAYGNSDNVYVQNGKLRYQGLELGTSVNFTTNLSVAGSFTAMNTEYVKTSENVGNRVSVTPNYVGALRVAYAVPQLQNLEVGADGRYVSTQKLDAANSIEIPGYFIFNLTANYNTRVSGHDLQLTAGVFNVANKRYWYAQSEGVVLVGMPRTVGIMAKISY
ncbi:iron complex outermembrane recepter protein [Pollutimonas bauzanensis]|uniref:Iron complex outermembrane recepter protein n=2 Tax=Pollutimonas bauzanensis TaxID=658167 RepID=A0A1M5W286_9BURK|nr:iron complex outermembrane recepter protein [Pollutimonas bauzanensis]